ncbi:MAG: choice-of-anchor Q domain-containing protein [Ardenticatenaceae bacterium]
MRGFQLFGGLTFLVFNFILIMGLVSAMSEPTMFDVNSTNDATDANLGDGVCETAPGNGTCTLRAAIQESNALAGEETIMLPAGTYTLTIGGVLEDEGAFGDLDITDHLILTGDGAENTIIDGNALDRVFHIANESALVQMSGLTIRNGHLPFDRGGGGGVYNEGTLQLSNSRITNNTVNVEGGGLLNLGSLTLNDNIITENNASYGGGVFNAGTVELLDNTITHNTAHDGAGFYNGNWFPESTATPNPTPNAIDRAAISNSSGATSTATPSVTPAPQGTVWSTPTNIPGPSPTAVFHPVSAMIENSIISENRGDGIYTLSTLTLSDSTVSHNNGSGINNWDRLTLNNSTVSSNNGIGLINGSYFFQATLNNSTISNNSDSGLYNNLRCNLTLNHSTVSGNSAYRGGGINNQGVLTLNNSLVTANSASDNGGGVFNYNDEYYGSGRLMLNNSTVSSNSANGNGGGIYSENRLTLNHSTISDNEANQNGGGIYSNANQPLTLNNSTISGNQTNLSGGAIYNAGKESTLNLSSVTISNNTADSDGNESGDGGGLFNFIGVVTMQNTIMGANHDHSPTTQHPDCSSLSVLNSLGYNLIIQDLTSCPVGGDTTGNLIDVEPNLGPLQDNGGPTWTHALLADSSALDAGNPAGCADENGSLLSYDQIGLPRTLDGNADGTARCDIGAYELSLTPITPVPITPAPPYPSSPTPIPTITRTPGGPPIQTHTPIATDHPQSVSANITSQGGSLTHTYPGHRTTLEVPPNALSAPSQFSISYHTPPAMSGRLIAMDHFFDVEASQSAFNQPLTLTITYSDTVRGPIMAGTEQLYGWQEGQWVTDGMTLTQRLPNQLTVQVDHLSVFGVLGETHPLYLPLIRNGN